MFPQIFGKYVLERQIASGGMAVVYLATLRGAGGFEKRLVVKQVRAELSTDDAFIQRFVDEAKTTVDLSHPNIVPVYELGVEQGVYFIAMELAEGASLAELLRAEGPLSPEEGAYLGVEVCRALDYAHRKAKVVHRDVTPRNVMIDEEGAVRLIDFGIAAPVARASGASREKVFGSPGYMPIEQMRGRGLSPATDVFAVGVLLIEAWTGTSPFRQATDVEDAGGLQSDGAPAERRSVRQEGGDRKGDRSFAGVADEAALRAPIPSLAAIDVRLESLAALVASAVAYEAAARPQSAEDLARPLRDFLRSADLGDIARRLGARVRAVRQSSAEPSESTGGTPPTRPLTAGSTGQSRTFAAGDRLAEWTRSANTSTHPTARAPSRLPRRAVLALLSAVALGATGLALGRRLQAPEAAPPVPAPSGRTQVPAPAPPPAPASTPAHSIVSSSSEEERVSPSAGRPPAQARPPRAPLGAPATLRLTSDLPAVVSIAGKPVGSTPHQVEHQAGLVAVSFVSRELGETVATTVELAAGQTLGIHAEFTRARPAVSLR